AASSILAGGLFWPKFLFYLRLLEFLYTSLTFIVVWSFR
ncbi:unnamed protein product, partial [Brassica rapa subsp. trilocularis]